MTSPRPETSTSPLAEEADTLSGSVAGPLDIIRNETALRYPVHSLTTGESVRIEIRRRDEKGVVAFLWEVSHNSKYGPPGHLAYKLDTLIVNRRIDEAMRGGKHVPKLLKLGSLSEIAREVGAGEKNTGAVKRALYQNAFAALTVKGLRYRAGDKSEQTFEFGDTRYGVVFTGERLPDGRKSDGVYVVFHDLYLQLLNTAQRRPLDYDYLRDLPPTAQRFYEIVSYEMLPALRYGQRARLSYARFCLLSTMTRYTDFERVKKQMYKIHRPHLEKGYLAKVEFEPTLDPEGNSDWNMFYIPGERARYQQQVFAFDPGDRRQQQRRFPAAAVGTARSAAAGTTSHRSGGHAALEATGSASSPSGPSAEQQALPLVENPGPAQELVRQFHEAFGRRLEAVPTGDPDLRVAAELLRTEGAERARFLVDFARREAPKTKYRPRTFRGILQYRGEAFAEWNAQQEAQRRREEETARENARKGLQEARRRAEEARHIQTLQELAQARPEALEAFKGYVEIKRRSDVEWKRRQGMLESILARVAEDYDTVARQRELYAEWVREYEEEAPAGAPGNGTSDPTDMADMEERADVAAAIAASLCLPVREAGSE